MTTPGAPGEVGQDAPRHARARRTPRAAALDRASAPSKAPKAPKAPKASPRQQLRTRQRAKLATRGARFTPEGAALAGADIGARAARDAGRARLPTGNRQYQGVIVAEFLVAVLIVALAPLARGKAAQDTTGGPSPYGPDDIKQLAGIGAVYFVLALLSSGKHGRLSAWFGGLVLVAIGLAETTSGGLPAIFGIFQPSSKSSGAGEAGNFGAGLGQSEPFPNPAGTFPTPEGLPTPTGQPAANQQFVTFTGPGVATTTETTPGVTVT